MKWGELGQALVGMLAAVTTLIGAANRRHRRRNSVKEDLKLLDELENTKSLLDRDWALDMLKDRIALDVARLSGVKLGTPKKPIPWGTAIFTAVSSLGLGYWTYILDLHSFNWYSLIPGTLATLLGISFFGQFVDREQPPSDMPSDQETDFDTNSGTI
jgi:hypothetical protein